MSVFPISDIVGETPALPPIGFHFFSIIFEKCHSAVADDYSTMAFLCFREVIYDRIFRKGNSK